MASCQSTIAAPSKVGCAVHIPPPIEHSYHARQGMDSHFARSLIRTGVPAVQPELPSPSFPPRLPTVYIHMKMESRHPHAFPNFRNLLVYGDRVILTANSNPLGLVGNLNSTHADPPALRYILQVQVHVHVRSDGTYVEDLEILDVRKMSRVINVIVDAGGCIVWLDDAHDIGTLRDSRIVKLQGLDVRRFDRRSTGT
ncbi:hypothetical protein EW146_g3086 [Bondarzewia mesenterica]|uniref:Uncharacterized protein n=1 Tax=Bondarzewia mesenterica TaxID=1095465 RepID=A0A4S4LYK6_9AGAM|nr:hypothetical protein EW146_g3086 [Bondarzewia mesenterica]